MKVSNYDYATAHDQDGEWDLYQLCDLCKALRFDFDVCGARRFDYTQREHTWYPDLHTQTRCVRHHPTAHELLKSASLNCHLCTLIVACFRGRLELNEAIDVRRDDPRILAYMMTLIPGGLYLSINQGINSLRLYPDSYKQRSAVHEIAELPLIENPETDGARQYYLFAPITSISTKFQTCRGHHDLCKSQCKSYLPTRVLNISRGIESVRLVTVPTRTTSRNRKLRRRLISGYATVSHRWQGNLQCKTTTTNIKQFHKAIPSTNIPQHFRDAILLARKLGIQFLWIDSLCIIQEGDNGEDFNREALEMASVYERAQINISIDVHDASRGFLPVNLREVRACTIPAFSSLTPDLWVAPWPFMIPRTQPAVGKGGLNGRAWIMQESLLARRAIHCTPFGLIWECHEDHAGLEDQVPKRRAMLKGADLLPLLEYGLTKQDFHTTYGNREFSRKFTTWYAMVEEFSRRRITVPSDKLIAISGIAKRFAMNHDDLGQYVAGLWTNDIVFGLGWYCPGENRDSCRGCTHSHEFDNEEMKVQAYRPLKGLESYRAPSFSWASKNEPSWISFTPHQVPLERTIQNGGDKYQPVLMSTFMETVQTDPFGLPIRGSIVLKGFHASRNSFFQRAWVRDGIRHNLRHQYLGETGILFMDDILYHRLRRPEDLPEKAILFLLASMPLARGIVLYPALNKDKRLAKRYRRIGYWGIVFKDEREIYSDHPFDFSLWTEITVTII